MGTANDVLNALQKYDLKDKGGGRYRSRSPFRSESDDPSFSLLVTDQEHGGWRDWVTLESGSLYDLAEHLGIERQFVAGESSHLTTKKAYRSLEEYAAAHHVPADAFLAAGWTTVRHGQEKKLALQFHTKSGNRWRYLDGGKPRFTSVTGYKKCWYGIERAIQMAVKNNLPLVICNGEPGVVVGQYFGVAATCVTAGEHIIPAYLIDELRAALGQVTLQILIALDCDEKGITVARDQEAQLLDAGFDAKAVKLGLHNNGDLGDFCGLMGEESAQALTQLPRLTVADTNQFSNRKWQIIPLSGFYTLPPVEWVLEGQIQRRTITVIFGPSNAGKSFLAIHYAATFALAGERIMYMAYESEEGIGPRMLTWQKHHNKTVSDQNFRGMIGAVEILYEGDLNAFIEANRDYKPTIVFVDTLARAFTSGDENDGFAMKQFLSACETLRRELDCTVVLIHHTNKEGYQERGSSVLRANAGGMLRVIKEDDLIKLEPIKVKESSQGKPSYWKLLPYVFLHDKKTIDSAVILPSQLVIQTLDDPLTNKQLDILGLIAADPEGGMSRGEIVAALHENVGVVARALTQLKKRAYVYQKRPQAPYKITPDGLQYFNNTLKAEIKETGVIGVIGPVSEKINRGYSTPPPDHPDHPDHPRS